MIYFSNLVIIKHKFKYKINIIRSCLIISYMGIINHQCIKRISPWINSQMLCLLSFKRVRYETLLKRNIGIWDHFMLIIKLSNLINNKFINKKRIIQHYNFKIKILDCPMQHKLTIIIIFMEIMKSLNLKSNLIFV